MDTTKTDQPTDRTAQPAEAEEATAEGVPNAVSEKESHTEAPAKETATGSSADRLDEPATAPAAAPAASSGVFSGAAAVAAAGLGLASLTGTWLGTMLQEREQLTGQIKAQSGAAANQIEAVYGTPWHTTAFFNGLFGLAAVVIAAVVLLRQRTAASASGATWVSAVAWGAVALGVIGLLIAAVMGLDVFTPMPKVPASPGGAPTG
ncbi:hypothetical protein [Streptomyces botrytidirepellens]|uniref:Uncharacterized protein n=1 Tax=Streptomyces botrytidirepellens TaxID=2486417 RepID=A0A3M8X124_9ACTN|nr:hypothetical protein [Streptomyces botrytidirepellens]RNG34093.1 hypothetical protein EEJ42_06595 [Streptomyces botrytidirepellens]